MDNSISKTPVLILGGTHEDVNGTLSFINGFNFKNVKRFYHVKPNKKGTIRAFHGHFLESKFLYVSKGKVLVYLFRIDKKVNPSKKAKTYKFTLSADKPKILYVPPSFANGFKSLQKDSEVIFFSDKTLDQSKKDDYRFPFDYWGSKIWNENK